jgi:hypothetical protein
MVSIHPMISPMVPITFMTPYKYPVAQNSHSFEPKNGNKMLENMFFGNPHFCNVLFYTQIIWLGTYFYVQTLGRTSCPLADFRVPFWIYLGVPKWPSHEQKTA